MTKKTKIWLAVIGGILVIGGLNAPKPPKAQPRAPAGQEKAREGPPPQTPAKAAQTAPDAGEAPPPQTPIAKALASPPPPQPPAPALPASYWDDPELVQCDVQGDRGDSLWAIIPGFFPPSADQFERRRLSPQRQKLTKQLRESTFVGRITDSHLKVGNYNFRRETLPVSIDGNLSCGRPPNAVAVKFAPQTINIPMPPVQAEQLMDARSRRGFFSRRGDLTVDVAFRAVGGRIVRQVEPEVRARRIALRVRDNEVVLFDSEASQ